MAQKTLKVDEDYHYRLSVLAVVRKRTLVEEAEEAIAAHLDKYEDEYFPVRKGQAL